MDVSLFVGENPGVGNHCVLKRLLSQAMGFECRWAGAGMSRWESKSRQV